jgi:hypothetical protein
VQNPIAYLSGTQIGSTVEMNISMTINNTILATDVISFTIPPEISCLGVTAVTVGGYAGGSINITNSNNFQFKNIAMYNPYPINVTIDNFTLPNYAAVITSPFLMIVSRGIYLVCMMNTTFTIQLSAGSIAGSLTPSRSEAGVSANYTFSLTL